MHQDYNYIDQFELVLIIYMDSNLTDPKVVMHLEYLMHIYFF